MILYILNPKTKFFYQISYKNMELIRKNVDLKNFRNKYTNISYNPTP